MQHILYKLFLDDTLKYFDEKYKDIILKEKDKTFLYANIIEFTKYYKLFSKKDNKDYGLYQKLHTKKYEETINLLKQEILENNYDTEALFYLYGYVSHLIFDYYSNTYIKNLMSKNKIKETEKNFNKVAIKIESLYYQKRYNEKIKKHKTPSDSYELSARMKELINKVLKEIHLNSMGIKVYEISLSNYKKTKENILYKLITKIFSSKKYTASKKFKVKKVNKKIDYLNENKTAWYQDGILQVNYSFIELYEKAILETLNIITGLNEEIFYKKKIKNSPVMQLNALIKK